MLEKKQKNGVRNESSVVESRQVREGIVWRLPPLLLCCANCVPPFVTVICLVNCCRQLVSSTVSSIDMVAWFRQQYRQLVSSLGFVKVIVKSLSSIVPISCNRQLLVLPCTWVGLCFTLLVSLGALDVEMRAWAVFGGKPLAKKFQLAGVLTVHVAFPCGSTHAAMVTT